jgi:hypothetical protein
MYGGLLPNRFALRTLSAPPGLMILGCFTIRAPFYLTARMKPIARMILMIVDVVANSSKSRLLMFLLLSKADQGKYRVKRLGVGLVFFAPVFRITPGGYLLPCKLFCSFLEFRARKRGTAVLHERFQTFLRPLLPRCCRSG